MITDEITKRRMINGSPDREVLLQLNGYTLGNSGKTRWVFEVVSYSENMALTNKDHLADLFDKWSEAIRRDIK